MTFWTSLKGIAGPALLLELTTLNDLSGGSFFSANVNVTIHSPLGLLGACTARTLTVLKRPVARRRCTSAPTAAFVEENPGVSSDSPKSSASVGTPLPSGRPSATILEMKKV